jgi:hypothetical protein
MELLDSDIYLSNCDIQLENQKQVTGQFESTLSNVVLSLKLVKTGFFLLALVGEDWGCIKTPATT